MMGKLQQYIESGGHVLFVSGNNIYREVEFNPSYLEVINQKIDIKTTTSLTGTYYTDAGYNSSAPFKVVAPNHWLFAGANLKYGDVFGRYSANRGGGASGWETDKVNVYSEGFKTLAVGLNKVGPGYIVIKNTLYGGWV